MLGSHGIRFRKGESLTAEQVQRIWQEGDPFPADTNEDHIAVSYRGRLYQLRVYETGKGRTVVTGERVG